MSELSEQTPPTKQDAGNPATFDARLVKFEERNPQCKISYSEGQLVIDQPFGYDDSQLTFAEDDIVTLDTLAKVSLKLEFDAIFHHDLSQAEFIYGYLDPNDNDDAAYWNRSFSANYLGHEYKCWFAEPSKELFKLASGFKVLPSASGKGVEAGFQLRYFRDAQRQSDLPKRAQEFFVSRQPLSFYVACSSQEMDKVDLPKLAQLLNFLMHYYDRETPRIVIRKRGSSTEEKAIEGLRFIEESFPAVLTVRDFESIPMQLLEAARKSPPRMAFLYCYQDFEFAGSHYIDVKAKSALLRVLRDPAIYQNLSVKVGDVHAIFAETMAQSDDSKMEKIIEDGCDPKLIWREVKKNRDFFASECRFTGGLAIPALIGATTDEDSWVTMGGPKLFKNLTKIRNCLVHAREKREPNSILPDRENDLKLAQFVPVIRRMAEQIVFYGGTI